MKILNEQEQESLEAKAIQLKTSGLWKGCVELVVNMEIEKLNDSWHNKEAEDIPELAIKKKLLLWLKDMPGRITREAKDNKKG